MLVFEFLDDASFEVKRPDKVLLASDVEHFSIKVKGPDCFLGRSKALVDNSILYIDGANLFVPATCKEHIAGAVVQGGIDRVAELVHEVADAVLGVPQADGAVIGAGVEPVFAHDRNKCVDFVNVAHQRSV